MNDKSILDFRQRLDQQYNWPALYMFKFIVPHGKEQGIKRLFPKNDILEKLSTQGNYSSLTIQMMLNSSEEVIRIYNEAGQVEGVISL